MIVLRANAERPLVGRRCYQDSTLRIDSRATLGSGCHVPNDRRQTFVSTGKPRGYPDNREGNDTRHSSGERAPVCCRMTGATLSPVAGPGPFSTLTPSRRGQSCAPMRMEECACRSHTRSSGRSCASRGASQSPDHGRIARTREDPPVAPAAFCRRPALVDRRTSPGSGTRPSAPTDESRDPTTTPAGWGIAIGGLTSGHADLTQCGTSTGFTGR
jgi:hypothetical protein